MRPEFTASEGQLWRMRGMEHVLAVRASFIRGFGWSTICRTRQRNVCSSVWRTLLQCLRMSSSHWMLLMRLFVANASMRVEAFLLLRFRSRRDRRRQKQWSVSSGGLKWAIMTRIRCSEFLFVLISFCSCPLQCCCWRPVFLWLNLIRWNFVVCFHAFVRVSM